MKYVASSVPVHYNCAVYTYIFYSRYVLVCSNDKLDFSCPFRGLKIFKILPPNAIECEPSTPPSKY